MAAYYYVGQLLQLHSGGGQLGFRVQAVLEPAAPFITLKVAADANFATLGLRKGTLAILRLYDRRFVSGLRTRGSQIHQWSQEIEVQYENYIRSGGQMDWRSRIPEYADNDAEGAGPDGLGSVGSQSFPVSTQGPFAQEHEPFQPMTSLGEIEARFQERAICYFHNDRIVYERLNVLGAPTIPKLLASGVLQAPVLQGIDKPAAFNVPGLLMEYRDGSELGERD